MLGGRDGAWFEETESKDAEREQFRKWEKIDWSISFECRAALPFFLSCNLFSFPSFICLSTFPLIPLLSIGYRRGNLIRQRRSSKPSQALYLWITFDKLRFNSSFWSGDNVTWALYMCLCVRVMRDEKILQSEDTEVLVLARSHVGIWTSKTGQTLAKGRVRHLVVICVRSKN